MTGNLKVFVNPATVEVGSSGTVSGAIWVEVNGREFPEAGWYDFPVRLLLTWFRSSEQLVSGRSGSEQFYFMDGPYRFVVATHDGKWGVEFVERDVVVASVESIDHAGFRDSIVNACRDTVRALNARNWLGAEYEELARIPGNRRVS